MTYVRLVTTQGDPSKVEEAVRFFREQALVTMRQQPGFQEAQLLVDRRSGKLISVSRYENEATARAADSSLSQTRTQGAQLIGASSQTAEVFELVVNETAIATPA
jgi:hypothetical protein